MGEEEQKETSVIIFNGASRCTVLIIKEDSPSRKTDMTEKEKKGKWRKKRS